MHVLGRMTLTGIVLGKKSPSPGDSHALSVMRMALEPQQLRLYKALLLFQIKSVYAYYRNRFAHFFRDIVKLDSWADDDLLEIQKLEDHPEPTRPDISSQATAHAHRDRGRQPVHRDH